MVDNDDQVSNSLSDEPIDSDVLDEYLVYLDGTGPDLGEFKYSENDFNLMFEALNVNGDGKSMQTANGNTVFVDTLSDNDESDNDESDNDAEYDFDEEFEARVHENCLANQMPSYDCDLDTENDYELDLDLDSDSDWLDGVEEIDSDGDGEQQE